MMLADDNAYNAAKAVDDFLDSHEGQDLTDEDRNELKRLMNNRAAALSDVLGVKIHTVCEDD